MRREGSHTLGARKRSGKTLAARKRNERICTDVKRNGARHGHRAFGATILEREAEVRAQVENGETRTSIIETRRAKEQVTKRDRRIGIERDVTQTVTAHDDEASAFN